MTVFAQLRCAIAAMFIVVAVSAGATTAHGQVRIAVVGDSNVSGLGVSASETYPAKLERALQAKGIQANVLNAGISGDTLALILTRLDSAVPQGTHVAIVWAGIHDLQRDSRSPEQVEATRRLITSRLNARGVEVIHIRHSDYYHELRTNPKYLVKGGGGAAFATDQHFNPAGFDEVLARTLPQILSAISRAKRVQRTPPS